MTSLSPPIIQFLSYTHLIQLPYSFTWFSHGWDHYIFCSYIMTPGHVYKCRGSASLWCMWKMRVSIAANVGWSNQRLFERANGSMLTQRIIEERWRTNLWAPPWESYKPKLPQSLLHQMSLEFCVKISFLVISGSCAAEYIYYRSSPPESNWVCIKSSRAEKQNSNITQNHVTRANIV